MAAQNALPLKVGSRHPLEDSWLTLGCHAMPCCTGPVQAVSQSLGQVVINLPYDYTDVMTSGITFDTYSQTMYMILFNNNEPGSQCAPHTPAPNIEHLAPTCRHRPLDRCTDPAPVSPDVDQPARCSEWPGRRTYHRGRSLSQQSAAGRLISSGRGFSSTHGHRLLAPLAPLASSWLSA